MYHFLCAWLLIANSVSTNVSRAPPSNAATIEEITRMLRIADDLTTLARLVNGISLGQGLADGTVKVDTVVEELLNLPPNVTLDSLVSGGVGGLDTDLGAIAKAVSENCGKEGGCGDVSDIAPGLKVLEEISQVIGQVEKAISTTSHLMRVFAIQKSIRHFLVFTKTVRGSFGDTVFKYSKSNRVLFFGYNLTTKLTEMRAFVKDMVTSEKEYVFVNRTIPTLEYQGIADDFAKILQIDKVSNDHMSKQKAVKKMSNSLVTMQKVLSVLRPLVSKDAVKGVNEKLDALGRLIDSRSQGVPEKKHTGTYLGGMDALEEYSGDVETEFVTETIGNGKGVEGLRQLLTPVDRLFEGLHPLRNSWKQLRLDGKREAVEDVKRRLEAAAREVNSQYADTILSVPSADDCFKGFNLTEKFNTTPWADVVSRDQFDKSVKEAGELIIQSEFVFNDTLRDLAKVDDSQLKTFLEIYDFQVNMYLLRVKILDFESLLFMSMKGFTIDPTSVVPEWIENAGFKSALECLKNNTGLTSSQFSAASFASVPNLQLSTDSVRSVLGASAAMKSVLGEWKTFESGSNQSRTRRSALLAGGGKLSEELAAGVRVLRNVADVYRKRRAIERVLGAQDSIDAAVNGLQDAKQKSEAESVWTAETKRGLRSLVEGTVHKWAQSMEEVPEKISDYESVFRKAHALDYPSIDTRKLKRALGFLTKPPGIQEALGAIGELDLQFVNAKSRLDTASGTLPTLMAFFDGLLGISRVVTTTPAPTTEPPPETTTTTEAATSPEALPTAAPLEKSPSEPDSSDLLTIIIIVLAVMLVVAIGLNLVQVYMSVQKKKEDEKRKEKDKKKQKAKKEESKEKGSKEVDNETKGKPPRLNSLERPAWAVRVPKGPDPVMDDEEPEGVGLMTPSLKWLEDGSAPE